METCSRIQSFILADLLNKSIKNQFQTTYLQGKIHTQVTLKNRFHAIHFELGRISCKLNIKYNLAYICRLSVRQHISSVSLVVRILAYLPFYKIDYLFHCDRYKIRSVH